MDQVPMIINDAAYVGSIGKNRSGTLIYFQWKLPQAAQIEISR
jgi:hypothetical protein